MSSAPLYIVSKGRADRCATSHHLTRMGIAHYIVAEGDEVDAYRANTSATVLTLPPIYKSEYDTFDEHGLSKSTGPGPARNFAWDHSMDAGAAWHWVMDDNIDGFFRLNYNLKTPCKSSKFFEVMEIFVRRYKNIAMAGPNYFKFVSRKSKLPPFVSNTRIYSCNLIRNDVPFRWRGRYNEDTDLSIRMLKAGWCTVQFNAFLQDKRTTQLAAGGNTGEFYATEGTGPKSAMLARMHPDIARVTERFGRAHHFVDYTPFKRNKLKLADGVDLSSLPPVDNFGMILQQEVDGLWVNIGRPTFDARPQRHYSKGAR